MSTRSINNFPPVPLPSLIDQTSANSSTQGISNVQEMPATLLSRLSGADVDKPAFNPALIHTDSFLPHVANELAQRPLNDSEGARAAREALNLVESLQGKPVADKDLAKLEELRARAWENDWAAGKYCDTLARVLLLRPLTEKLETLELPEARAQLADVLHTQVERLLSAETRPEFLQIASELRATQELFKQEGMMGPEQETAFKRLNDIRQYHHKVHTETFPALQEDATRVLNHDTSAKPLDSVLQNAIALHDSLEPRSASLAPQMGRLGIQPLQAKAASLASELRTFSERESGELARQIDTLLTQIRSPEADLTDVGKHIGGLRKTLEEKSSVLTGEHKLDIQKNIDRLQGAVEVRRRVNRGENALKHVHQGTDAMQLEALKAELENGADALALYPEDKKQLVDILGKLENTSKELQAIARLEESNFAANIGRRLEAASQEEYNGLAEEINARLKNLPKNGNLSTEQKMEAEAKLKDLAQQCLVKEFMPLVEETLSTRRNAPSVAECARNLQKTAERRGIDPEAIGARLAEISRKEAKSLDSKITALQARIPDMSAKALRNDLPLMDLVKAMERRLLPEDRKPLDAKLTVLISQAEEALFAKTAGPEMEGNGAFAKLDASQKAAIRELCIQGGCQETLISALKDAAAGADGLEPPLEAAARIFAAKHENRTPDLKDIEQLDSFFLPLPELDDTAQNILGSNGKEPDYRFVSARNSRDLGTYMNELFPKGVKRDLGLGEKTPVGVDTLEKLVGQAANASGRKGRVLKKVDLMLLQALWCAKKAQNPSLSFENFKQTLPQAFRTIPMLQAHLDSGIRGRHDLQKLGQTVEDVSHHGLGSKKALVHFLTEVQASNPKWAAASAANGLYRALGLSRNSDLREVFRNAVQDTHTEQTKQTTVPALTADQKKQIADTALGAANDLSSAKRNLEKASQVITLNPTRIEMGNRLGIKSSILQGADPIDIKGATLATGILMAERILSDTRTDMERKQKLLKCICFQSHCKLDGKTMEGFKIGKSDKLGTDFMKTLETLRTTKDQKTFDAARTKILGLCNDAPSSANDANRPELKKRAEAVLYFKNFGTKMQSATEQIKHEFENIEDGKENTIAELNKTDPGTHKFYEEYRKSVSKDMLLVIGTGQKQTQVLKSSEGSQESLNEELNKTLEKAKAAYTKEEQKTLSRTAALVVCEQFAQNETVTTVNDVKTQYALHQTNLKSWPFYKGCLDQMTGMGISEEHAGLYLQNTFKDMTENFFADWAKKGLQSADNNVEIDRLVEGWMNDVEDPTKSLTFQKTHGVSVDVPLVEGGAVEVSAHLEVARENGISVWKDNDGYHMTLMKGTKASLGFKGEVGLDWFISTLEYNVGLDAKGSLGCDLLFPNRTQCHMFLSGVLSGRASTEHLGLCKQVSIVHEGEVGANAKLSLGVSVAIDEDIEDSEIASASVGVGTEISAAWAVTQNNEHTQHTRTIHGSISLSAEASIGTSWTEDVQETTGEAMDNMAYLAEEGFGEGEVSGVLQDVKSGTEAQLNPSVDITFQREFEERREVTTNTKNGALEGSERVRAFVLNGPGGAARVLRHAGASEQSIRDILADIGKLPPGEEFRIELVSNMSREAIKNYNSEKAKGKKPYIKDTDFELREVRLVTEDSLERSNTLNLRVLSLQSGRSMKQTHTETYDARPVLQQAA